MGRLRLGSSNLVMASTASTMGVDGYWSWVTLFSLFITYLCQTKAYLEYINILYTVAWDAKIHMEMHPSVLNCLGPWRRVTIYQSTDCCLGNKWLQPDYFFSQPYYTVSRNPGYMFLVLLLVLTIAAWYKFWQPNLYGVKMMYDVKKPECNHLLSTQIVYLFHGTPLCGWK